MWIFSPCDLDILALWVRHNSSQGNIILAYKWVLSGYNKIVDFEYRFRVDVILTFSPWVVDKLSPRGLGTLTCRRGYPVTAKSRTLGIDPESTLCWHSRPVIGTFSPCKVNAVSYSWMLPCYITNGDFGDITSELTLCSHSHPGFGTFSPGGLITLTYTRMLARYIKVVSVKK